VSDGDTASPDPRPATGRRSRRGWPDRHAGATTIQHCAFDYDSADAQFGGQAFGGAIDIVGGSVCISKNTSFLGDTATNDSTTTTSNVVGAYTTC
jgi:hypothetical protein